MFPQRSAGGARALPVASIPVVSNSWTVARQALLQARVLEWVAISFSRRFFRRRALTRLSHTAGRLNRLSHQGACVYAQQPGPSCPGGQHPVSMFLDFLLEGAQGEEGHLTSESRFVFPRFPLISLVTWMCLVFPAFIKLRCMVRKGFCVLAPEGLSWITSKDAAGVFQAGAHSGLT